MVPSHYDGDVPVSLVLRPNFYHHRGSVDIFEFRSEAIPNDDNGVWVNGVRQLEGRSCTGGGDATSFKISERGS